MSEPDLQRLRAIVARLRAPDGCPWDLRQDLASMRRYLLEECYEVLDVMEGDDPGAHAEELGDLLFQIAFHAQLREERGEFSLADVVDAISDKLERRHPHVFGDGDVAAPGDPAAGKARWEALKAAEGKGGIADVPRALPALMRAEKIGKKAADEGFDWPDVAGPLAKVEEELAELRAAIADAGDDRPSDATRHAIGAELGDLLFAVVNAARHLGVTPELALDGTTDRFLARYLHLRRGLTDAGRAVADADDDELDARWVAAKADVG